MADIIRVLPEAIANQIAAGEVIERPAAVVKELMENSVDAGAQNIKVIIKEAGSSLVQVVDNGSGMSTRDARKCFERYATSKIKKIEDLQAIHTMGFRGEALASMAAIAHVEIKTRRQEDELGTRVLIEGSAERKQEACSCAIGTSISVKNLFYNVPARRNFLRTKNVEMKHIIEEFQRVSMAYPKIAFSLVHNTEEIYHLNGGNLKQRIIGLYKKSYSERLVPVDETTDLVKISGFIGKPEYAKKTRGETYFIVNNRFVRNPYLHHAVITAYGDLLPERAHPLYVLLLEVDMHKVDINVHPSKQEIKFQDEQIIYTMLNSAVRHALAHHNITPSLDFDRETGFDRLESFSQNRPDSQSSDSGVPINSPLDLGRFKRTGTQQWEAHSVNENETLTLASIEDDDTEEIDPLTPFQVHRQFIFSQLKSGFVLIDQQAAHERILYEKNLRALAGGHAAGQNQLHKEEVQINTADLALFSEILPEIRALGFGIKDLSGQGFVIESVPIEAEGSNLQEMMEELLEQYKASQSTDLRLKARESLAISLAAQAAIKRGKVLSTEEIRSLIDELFACEEPNVTPRGRRTFITFNLDELQAQFERP